MKKLSDIERQKILQQKLSDFEVNAPLESEDFIFDRLRALRQNKKQRRGTKAILTAGILTLTYLVYYSFHDGNNKLSPDKFKTLSNNSVAVAPIGETKEKKNQSERISSPKPVIATAFPALSKTRRVATIGTKAKLGSFISQPPTDLLSVKPGLSALAKADYAVATTERNPQTGSLISPGVPDSSVSKPEIAKPMQKELKNNSAPDFVDSAVGQVIQEVKRNKRIFLTFSAQPFLAYKDIRPIADGIYVYHFTGPSSISTNRLGVKMGASVEHEFGTNRFISLGLSWFSFKNSFHYLASEEVKDIHTDNNMNGRTNGIAILLGARQPLKITSRREQFFNFGIEVQRVSGASLSQKTQAMISIGYVNQLVLGKSYLRITPTFNYSITKLHYPGVMVQPYWVGLEIGYSIPVRK